MKFSYLWILTVPICLSALEEKPWFGNVWEQRAAVSFTYSRYPRVEGARPNIKSTANDKVLDASLGMQFVENWDGEIELGMAKTPRQPFSYRSVVGQIRYMIWDDVACDPVSICVGGNARATATRSLRDVSCPYSANADFEITGSVGKEWHKNEYWTYRVFLFEAFGWGNRGSGWNRFNLRGEANIKNHHRISFGPQGYFGFGDKTHIDVDHFFGYAKVAHRSIDLSLAYRYAFRIWGEISFEYTRRVYARLFPEDVNFWQIQYKIPFCIF